MKFRTVNLFPMGEEIEFLRRFNVRDWKTSNNHTYYVLYITNTRTHAREEKNNNIIHRIALDATASGVQYNNDNMYAAAAADNWIHRLVVVLLQVCLFSREGPPHTRGPEHNGPRRSLLSREHITYTYDTYLYSTYIYI